MSDDSVSKRPGDDSQSLRRVSYVSEQHDGIAQASFFRWLAGLGDDVVIGESHSTRRNVVCHWLAVVADRPFIVTPRAVRYEIDPQRWIEQPTPGWVAMLLARLDDGHPAGSPVSVAAVHRALDQIEEEVHRRWAA